MRIFNTWMGDAARMVITKAMLEVINEENLIQQAVVTGNVLVSGLEKLQASATGQFLIQLLISCTYY